jgi:DNA helicase HerA-like ATPase
VVPWDVFGRRGHPLRATVTDLGPTLLSRLLNLTDAQSGALQMAFRLADEGGLLLLDLADLRAVLQHLGERSAELRATLGHVASTSLGAIQRALLTLEEAGGSSFLGEPAFDVAELLRASPGRPGTIHLLSAEQLHQEPLLYGTTLLWLLSELYEGLPEVGDLPLPKLVLVFDEAHLLFDGAPDALVDRVERVVRLVRSKGVALWFVTQNPLDLPESVLAQLGNRVQHGLRAFTPKDQKAVRAAAETFRARPGLDTASAILELGVGEALLSFLDGDGVPSPVSRGWIRPPASRMEPLGATEHRRLVQQSPFAGVYDEPVDRESAFERLSRRTQSRSTAKVRAPLEDELLREDRPDRPAPKERPRTARGSKTSRRPARDPAEEFVDTLMSSAARTMGSAAGRTLVRGILGGLFGGR